MSLTFDPSTGKIFYNGREIGEHRCENGKSSVHLTLDYETLSDDWVVPLTYLAFGLNRLPQATPKEPVLSISMVEDGIAQEFDVPRLLIEKLVSRGNYVWAFHKTDVDAWPSPLHGHDYDKGLKLDVVTGHVYDVATRQRCKTVKRKHLSDIRDELRASSVTGGSAQVRDRNDLGGGKS